MTKRVTDRQTDARMDGCAHGQMDGYHTDGTLANVHLPNSTNKEMDSKETHNPRLRKDSCSVPHTGGRSWGGCNEGVFLNRCSQMSSACWQVVLAHYYGHFSCDHLPEGTKRATSVNVQLRCLQKDLRAGSISRDIVNFPSELHRHRIEVACLQR